MHPIQANGPGVASLLQLLSCREPSAFNPAVTRPDWRWFADLCDRHHVAPVVLRKLNAYPEHELPAELLAYLRERFFTVSLTNYLLANHLVSLTSLLEEHGIPALAYKGPALALTVYGDLALRQYQDLDLIVAPEHLSSAVRLIERMGFRQVSKLHDGGARNVAKPHHVIFEAPDQTHFVELHWQLAGHLRQAFAPELAKIWGRTKMVHLLRGSVRAMCDEDMFVVLCYHGAKHRYARLKWLLDIAELMRRSQGWDWRRIEELLQNRPGAAGTVIVGIALAQQLLGTPCPGEAVNVLPTTDRTRRVVDAITQGILGARNSESIDSMLLQLEPRAGVRYRNRAAMAVRSSKLFLQAIFEVSEHDRTILHVPPQLQFLYVCVRILRLSAKYSRRAARRACLSVAATMRASECALESRGSSGGTTRTSLRHPALSQGSTKFD